MSVTAVKVGGSLAAYPQKLKELCHKLGELSTKHRLVVVPGGGEFADAVRVCDKRFDLSQQASHRMAILGMDQYGLILSDLTPNALVVDAAEGFKAALDADKLPVFLPSKIMGSEDPLENSWNVTSDSIAAYIAYRLNCGKLVLITDVDGVFTDDPKSHPNAKLLERVSAQELLAMGSRTSVDAYLPKLLLQCKLPCYVVNGLFAGRVEAVLAGQRTVCSVIVNR